MILLKLGMPLFPLELLYERRVQHPVLEHLASLSDFMFSENHGRGEIKLKVDEMGLFRGKLNQEGTEAFTLSLLSKLNNAHLTSAML